MRRGFRMLYQSSPSMGNCQVILGSWYMGQTGRDATYASEIGSSHRLP